MPNGAKAARARETGEKFDQAQLDRVAALMQRYEKSAELAYILAVPPHEQSSDWGSICQTLTQSVTVWEIDPVVRLYASLGDAYRSGDRAAFNADVDLLTNQL